MFEPARLCPASPTAVPHEEDISGATPPQGAFGAPSGGESFHSKSLKALEQVRDAREVLRRMVDAIETDGRFPVEAYIFLQEGLELSVRRIHGAAAAKSGSEPTPLTDPTGASVQPTQVPPHGPPHGPPPRQPRHPHHVDGRQLCKGLRELAVQRWGRLAKAVLNGWGIHRTDDFGEMVFVLVENQFLQKTEGDRVEDFADVFPFRDLESDYRIEPGKIDVAEVHAR